MAIKSKDKPNYIMRRSLAPAIKQVLESGGKLTLSRYWYRQIFEVFDKYPDVFYVELIRTGRITDSTCRDRGSKFARPGCYIILASTGGNWGRSRRNYPPPPVQNSGQDSLS